MSSAMSAARSAVSLDSELKKKALRAGLSDFTNQFDTFTF